MVLQKKQIEVLYLILIIMKYFGLTQDFITWFDNVSILVKYRNAQI